MWSADSDVHLAMVGRRLAQLDDVIVHAARLARSDRRAPVMLRSCVERLLIESEIARLTLLLDPRPEKLLSCIDEMRATRSLAEEICRRCGRSSRAISRTLSDARQLIDVLALELRPHVMQFEGVPQ